MNDSFQSTARNDQCIYCKQNPKNAERFTCFIHYVCETCLFRVCLKNIKSSYESDFLIYCPICENGSNLNCNYFISDSMFDKSLFNFSNSCQGCEKEIYEFHCDQCETLFCKNCLNLYHTPNKAFSNHTLIRKTTIWEDIDKIDNESLSPIKNGYQGRSPVKRLTLNSNSGANVTDNKKLSFLKERRKSMQNKNMQEEKAAKKRNLIKSNEAILNNFKRLFNEIKTCNRCDCILKNKARFECQTCKLIICEVCVLTTHKEHDVVPLIPKVNIENKYTPSKELEPQTMRSLDGGSISPKNEIIKYEREKPRPSIHHSNIKLNLIDIMNKEKKNVTKNIEIPREDENFISTVKISKDLAQLKNNIVTTLSSKLNSIGEVSLKVKEEILGFNEYLQNKGKINQNQSMISSTTNNVPANQSHVSAGLNNNEKRGEDKTIEKFIFSIKTQLKELQGNIESKEKSVLNLENIDNLNEKFTQLNNNLINNERKLIGVFYSHLSNSQASNVNPHVSIDTLDNEKEDANNANAPKKKSKSMKHARDSILSMTSDILSLKGFQITSSRNMSKDTFPNMMAVFQTSSSRDFLTYINNLYFEIIVLEFNPEFKYKGESFKKLFLNNKIKLRGHYANINCLRYYFFKGKDLLFSCSDDGTIKGWDCNDFTLDMNISYGLDSTDPVYTLTVITFQEENYLLIGAYAKDAPIKVYNNTQGIILKYLPIKGYTYHLDSYFEESNDCRFIFASVVNRGSYEVLLFDYGTGEQIFKFQTRFYVHSFIMTNQDNKILLTMMDRTGTIYQYNFSGYRPTLLKQTNGNGYYGLMRWDSKYMISIGKEASFEVINSSTLEIVKSYKNAHDDSIRNVCRFKHQYFGYILLTYGEDQRIKLFK